MKLLFATTSVLLMLTPVAASIHDQKFKAAEPKNDREAAVCLISVADDTVQSLIADPIGQSTASRSAAVTEAVRTFFNSAVEAETAFAPFYLTGDFNGDGGQDILIVVRIKGRRNTLPKDVTVLNPFGLYGKATFPAGPAAEPALAFAVIHGTRAGWQTPQSTGKFLLFGGSPILIMNHGRTTSGPNDSKDLMSLIKLNKRRREEWLPPTVKKVSKGDVIFLPTEAVESYLYWNGKTYRWEEYGEP